MNISNYYWFFQSVIPPRICDLIVKYGKSEKEREIMAITGGYGRDRDLNKQPLTKDEIKDFIIKLSSKYADFLYSILQDLTIIKELNSSLIFKLLKPIVNRASVLALSKYFK